MHKKLSTTIQKIDSMKEASVKKEKTSKNSKNIDFKNSNYFKNSLEKITAYLIEKDIQQLLEKLSDKSKRYNNHYIHFNEVNEVFKKHASETPWVYRDYLEQLDKRWNQFNRALHKLHKYPLNNLTANIDSLCKDFNIESNTLKELVKEVNNSIINIVIKNTILFEKQVATHLYQEELDEINLSYYVNNTLMKEFAPHNYDNYKIILNKTMHAYHKDLMSFLDKTQKETALVDNFFEILLDQINELQGKSTELQKTIENHRIITKEQENNHHYPPHIFKNRDAYNLFKDLIHDAIKQDEIGFYFRYMKEIENTPLIICKETVFREWYNTQDDRVIELKNPIKTYDRIGNKAVKLRPYKEAREKHKALDVSRLVA